jgi:hypothetical protein
MTAGELMAKLNADPAFVSRRAKQEAERQRRDSDLGRAEEPLVADLRAAGYEVESVWDLVNGPDPYLTAVPLLLDHLPRPYPGPVREGIARALALPEAKSAWNLLTRMFREEQDKRARDGLAVAIAAASDDEVIRDVIAFARDRRYGPSRLLLLSALERSSDSRARATLMELGTDPELKKEIRVILRRVKSRAKQ